MDNITRRDREMAYISDAAVMRQQAECRKLLQQLNFMDRSDFEALAELSSRLLGGAEGAFINPPFYCDYGSHIKVGKNFFANYNCKLIDGGKITFGDDVLVGPDCTFLTPLHPTDPQRRKAGYMTYKPITVGNNVWFGAGVTVCPGVTIGDNCTIGAGSVVVKDIPAGSIAVGNPCRVIRKNA